MKTVFFIVALLAFSAGMFAQAPSWSVNSSEFEYTMTITAQVKINGEPFGAPADMLGAFVGDQCRGVAYATMVEGYSYPFFFLTVFGNSIFGDTVRFQVFDANSGVVSPLLSLVVFNDGANMGTVSNPKVLSNNSSSVSQVLNSGKWMVFPNPAISDVTILCLDFPDAAVQIFNSSGIMVYHDFLQNGMHTLDVGAFLKGMYTIRLIGHKSKSIKLVIK